MTEPTAPTEASTPNLAAALVAFQAELPTVRKGETARVPTKSGGEYTYRYADLADVSGVVLPLLAKHGLAFTAKPTLAGGRFVLAYRLLHTSGESDGGFYPLPDSGSAQEYGSNITYARRYALLSVTGVAPDTDDDGAAARRTYVDTSRDPVEQARQIDEWTEALDAVADTTELEVVGRQIRAALRARTLTQSTFDHLVQVGAKKRAKLDQPMEVETAEPEPWPTPAPPAGRVTGAEIISRAAAPNGRG
jgi:hypothetical protein